MGSNNARLYFIDAIRAWAILMMLQGHFIDGLLDNAFRDNSNIFFSVWKYFRGITAPVFFTVSGFIFTYLLIKVPENGWDNPRVKKGIKRGLELLVIGYVLRLNLLGLLQGEIYNSFYLIDVLHCIGLSILGIIAIYVLTEKAQKWMLPTVLVGITMLLFIFEPSYKHTDFSLLPQGIANYLTKANGSVFTILPWFGYATFGSFISVLFTKYKAYRYLYTSAITLCLVIGLGLIFYSSDLFLAASRYTGIPLFENIFSNNYLFIRLGDVLLVFAVFMLLRKFLTNPTGLKLGQSTLSIYIIHFIILYGTFTGLGFYRFFHHSLNPYIVIPGSILFMISCSYLALKYEAHKPAIKEKMGTVVSMVKLHLQRLLVFGFTMTKNISIWILRLFGLIKN